MPKDRAVRSLADHRSSAAPYPSSSPHIKLRESSNPVDSVEDIREWEEARCPICMEHPHNAVLLICSSQEKGCRPYMCNTSHRHSNCLDQFYRSPVPSPSTALPQQVPPTGTSTTEGESGLFGIGAESKLTCPFCRGNVSGWVVSEAARQYLNSKPRSCSLETCVFSGTYSELRKHARSEHPYIRPSEVDPSRQSDWTRLEQETELEDFQSSIESALFEDEMDDGQLFMAENGSLDQMPLFEDNWSFHLSWALSMAEIVNAFLLQSLDQSRRQIQSRMPVRSTPRGRYGSESSGSARRANFPTSRRNAQRLRWRDHRWSASSSRR